MALSRPAKHKCTAVVPNRDGSYDIRCSRVGKGPLIHVWVHQYGNGGRGIILGYEESLALIEGLNDIVDEIEDDPGIDLTPAEEVVE